ncbi:MAG TPA: serine hydrolase, partial [Thermomicrobiaceae bacterium]|nr:serine hydrolase [Thermomicrobiaceae bacterium]
EADRDGDVVVPSASTRKVAILMTALKDVHGGKLNLDQPITIQERYQHNNSGCFQHLTPGFTITLRDALVMMIIVSDNTCTGTIADLVGLDAVNTLCRSIGMLGTTHRHGMPPADLPHDHPVDYTNATTPRDLGLLLDLILIGTHDEGAATKLGSTTELCRLALDILSWQKLNTRMPALLPKGTKVAHKTGTGARNYNDAGIVFRGDEPRYILTVYTEHVPEELPNGLPGFAAAAQLIAQLARECWDRLPA